MLRDARILAPGYVPHDTSFAVRQLIIQQRAPIVAPIPAKTRDPFHFPDGKHPRPIRIFAEVPVKHSIHIILGEAYSNGIIYISGEAASAVSSN